MNRENTINHETSWQGLVKSIQVENDTARSLADVINESKHGLVRLSDAKTTVASMKRSKVQHLLCPVTTSALDNINTRYRSRCAWRQLEVFGNRSRCTLLEIGFRHVRIDQEITQWVTPVKGFPSREYGVCDCDMTVMRCLVYYFLLLSCVVYFL